MLVLDVPLVEPEPPVPVVPEPVVLPDEDPVEGAVSTKLSTTPRTTDTACMSARRPAAAGRRPAGCAYAETEFATPKPLARRATTVTAADHLSNRPFIWYLCLL